MSNSRYPTLAATLEKRIAQGIYRDRLPTVRELAAEFKVSKQTVTLALRPLIVKGILKAEGRRGIHVAAPVKSPGIIGIVATGDMSILENDKKLKELQEQINRDGFESVLIGITNWISSRSVCKLLSDHFSGIIFTNSTLSFEIAEHLDRLLIPFVSCNRLPVYPHINYVETNWRGAIRQLAEDLADMGYRKLGLFFQGRLEGYNRIIGKEWRKIKEELSLPLLECDGISLDYRSSAFENLHRFLEILQKKQEYPELLILWLGLDEKIVKLLTEGPLRVPEATRILGYAKNGMQYPKQFTAFNEEESYSKTLFAAYEALREVMIAPTTKRIHRFIDYTVDIKSNLNKEEKGNV